MVRDAGDFSYGASMRHSVRTCRYHSQVPASVHGLFAELRSFDGSKSRAVGRQSTDRKTATRLYW